MPAFYSGMSLTCPTGSYMTERTRNFWWAYDTKDRLHSLPSSLSSQQPVGTKPGLRILSVSASLSVRPSTCRSRGSCSRSKDCLVQAWLRQYQSAGPIDSWLLQRPKVRSLGSRRSTLSFFQILWLPLLPGLWCIARSLRTTSLVLRT